MDTQMDLPPPRRLPQQTHWALENSDTLNHVGGPANSFQAICLVVTGALCYGRRHHLLRLACCRQIPCPSTTILDTTVAAAAWVRQGRELLLAAAATRESSGVRPGLMHRELGMSVPESPPC